MKVGDLVRLPQNLGHAIVVKVLHNSNLYNGMPTGDTAVMVMQGRDLDWWDADYCEVISESR